MADEKTIWDSVAAWLPYAGAAGLALSIFNTWQNLRKEQRKLRLLPLKEFIIGLDGNDDRSSLIIRAVNSGHRALTIHKARIYCAGEELYSLPWDYNTLDLIGGTNVIPKGLSQGEFCDIDFMAHYIAHNIKGDAEEVRLMVEVELATGEIFSVEDVLFRPKKEEFPQLNFV